MMCQAPLLQSQLAVIDACALQVTIPLWALVHLPVVITLTTACFTPRVHPELPTLPSCCPAASSAFVVDHLFYALACAHAVGAKLEHACFLHLQTHACQGNRQEAESKIRTQGWVHCILYVLFENAMGVVKLWAVVAGAHTTLMLPSLVLRTLVQAHNVSTSSSVVCLRLMRTPRAVHLLSYVADVMAARKRHAGNHARADNRAWQITTSQHVMPKADHISL